MVKFKLFFKSLFYIFFYFFISFLIYIIFANHIYQDSNYLLKSLSMIFSDLTILFIFIVLFRKKIIPDFYDFKKNSFKYIKYNFKYWFIGLILMIITNLVIGIFIGNMPTNEELNRQIIFENPFSSILSLVIIAPIIEELITRKTFKDVFTNQYIYIITSGLIFGSLHLLSATSISELLYIIPYSILGCAFAKIYFNTDNLWSNIFYHSLHNTIALLFILIGVLL